MTEARLFSPLALRGTTLPNRTMVSPMCMYSAVDGVATDYHLVHLGRFALGGTGLVMAEATGIAPEGRISHHDLGLWNDEQADALAPIARFIAAHGSVPGIQLAHAGRKASCDVPWRGGGPLEATCDFAPWQTVAPSAVAAGPGWPVPREMSIDEIAHSVQQWADAAARAVRAGFRVIELHGAHGYLLHAFQSPIANHRTDGYGGSERNRWRYPLEVVDAVRAAIGADIPLFYRISSVDGAEGGLGLDDAVAFSRELVAHGVDVIDCSSGGISTDRTTDTRIRRGYAFHADFSHAVKVAVEPAGAHVATVGLVVDPAQAEALLAHADADLIALGRELLEDPAWAHHARQALAGPDFSAVHVQAASFLDLRHRTIERLAASGETPLTRFEPDSPPLEAAP